MWKKVKSDVMNETKEPDGALGKGLEINATLQKRYIALKEENSVLAREIEHLRKGNADRTLRIETEIAAPFRETG